MGLLSTIATTFSAGDWVRILTIVFAGATFSAASYEAWDYFFRYRERGRRRDRGILFVRLGIAVGTVSIVWGLAARIGEPFQVRTVLLLIAFIVCLAGIVTIMDEDVREGDRRRAGDESDYESAPPEQY